MTWLLVSDTAADHPALLALGDEAFGALVRLGAYSARHLTDGVIPTKAATMLAPEMIDRLVGAEMLDKTGDGYVLSTLATEIVKVESKATVTARRKAWTGRQRKSREVGQEAEEAEDPKGRKKKSREASRRDVPRDSHRESAPPDPDPDPDPHHIPDPQGEAPSEVMERCVAALRAAAGNALVAPDPVPASLLSALAIAANGGAAAPADWALLGGWIAADGLGWMRDPPGLAYLADAARLADCIERARRWHAADRPQIARRDQRHGSASVPDWADVPSGQQP